MKTSKEVLLTTDTNNAFCNICVWDTESGSTRNSYKGGTSAANSLAFIGEHYIVSAQLGKPVVQLWEVHKRDQLCLHSVTPGLVSALAISPDGQICVAGIEDKLYVWLTATGQLKSVLRRHYQPVSAIKFTDDGCLFVSGGSDSLVIVWSSAEALAGSYEASGDEASSPEHIWSDHSLPVTSVVVGKGGSQARVFTSSLDQSCKVFDLVSGQLLLSVIFDVRVQCVAVDPVESALFVGGQDGSVFIVNLRSPPRTLEHHMSEDEKKSCSFLGHTKPVTCLTVSMDGTTIVSGSEDSSAKVWSVSSRQCLRTLPHKGPVTNVALILAPRGMLDPDSAKTTRKPPVAILARNKEETSSIHATFPILPRANLKNRLRIRPRTVVINLDEAGSSSAEGAENGIDGEWSEEETENQMETSEAQQPSTQKSVKTASRARYQNSILRMLE